MPKGPTTDRQMLIKLLCRPMTETARAEALGVARSVYYDALDRLAREGVLRKRGTLNPGMTFNGAHPRSKYSGGHHAPVQHVRWTDRYGRWAVQGAWLDEWEEGAGNDISVTIRWTGSGELKTSFPVRPITRWSTMDTRFNITWELSTSVVENLTVAIARTIHAEALLIPESIDVVGTN